MDAAAGCLARLGDRIGTTAPPPPLTPLPPTLTPPCGGRRGTADVVTAPGGRLQCQLPAPGARRNAHGDDDGPPHGRGVRPPAAAARWIAAGTRQGSDRH